ncbi:hypothetical protein ACOMHN_049030 [Nucella lapillus]
MESAWDDVESEGSCVHCMCLTTNQTSKGLRDTALSDNPQAPATSLPQTQSPQAPVTTPPQAQGLGSRLTTGQPLNGSTMTSQQRPATVAVMVPQQPSSDRDTSSRQTKPGRGCVGTARGGAFLVFF